MAYTMNQFPQGPMVGPPPQPGSGNYHSLYNGYNQFPGYGQGGYPGYQAPTQARAAYPVGGQGANQRGAPTMNTGATPVTGSPASGAARTATPAGGSGGGGYAMNSGQLPNAYTQSGNGPAGRAYGQQGGAMPSQYMPNFGGGGGYPFSSAPTAGVPGGGDMYSQTVPVGNQGGASAPSGSGGGVASITSAFGSPALPYAGGAPQQQTIDRAVEQALSGPSTAQLAYGVRGANSGLAPSAADMTAVNPTLAQRNGAAATAIAGIPYNQNLANSNALLNWQGGQGADILGQAGNLAQINNAQQQYQLAQQLALMDASFGSAQNQAGLYGSLFNSLFGGGGLLGGVGNLAGGVLGGL